MDLAQNTFSKPVTVDSLTDQTNAIDSRIQELTESINSQDEATRANFEELLDSKLNHVDDELRESFDKLGFDNLAALTEPGKSGIEKVLGYLTSSQARLEGMTGEIRKTWEKPQGKSS